MKNKKIIVWDLFGGLNGSVRKALWDQEEIYEIYTFDILKETKDGVKNIVLDLTSENVIEKLQHFPKPDIIVASPLCKVFSNMTAVKGGGNAHFKIEEDELLIRKTKEDYLKTKYIYENSVENVKQGILGIENTIKIIEHFKPNFWYIENPRYSLIWRYIVYNLKFTKGFQNVCDYGAYGFNFKKPTIIYSNIDLFLKKVDKNWKPTEYIKGNFSMNQKINVEERKNIGKSVKAKNRSDIPPQLIRDIFDLFKGDR